MQIFSLVLILVYLVTQAFMDQSTIGEIALWIRVVSFCTASMILLPHFVRYIQKPHISDADQLIVGVFLVSFFTASLGVWGTIGRMNNFSTTTAESALSAFLVACQTIGAFFVIAAAGRVDGRIPIGNWRWIAISIALGCTIAGVFIGFTLAQAINLN